MVGAAAVAGIITHTRAGRVRLKDGLIFWAAADRRVLRRITGQRWRPRQLPLAGFGVFFDALVAVREPEPKAFAQDDPGCDRHRAPMALLAPGYGQPYPGYPATRLARASRHRQARTRERPGRAPCGGLELDVRPPHPRDPPTRGAGPAAMPTRQRLSRRAGKWYDGYG